MKGGKIFSIFAVSLLTALLVYLLVQQPISIDSSIKTTGRLVSSESSPSVNVAPPSSSDSGSSSSGSSGSSDSSSSSSSGSSVGASSASSSSPSTSGGSGSSGSDVTPKKKSVNPSSTESADSVSPSSTAPATQGSSGSQSTTVASSSPSEETEQFAVTRGGTIPAGEIVKTAVTRYGLTSDARISYSDEDKTTTISGYRVGKLFGIIQVKVPVKATYGSAGELNAKAPFWATFVR